MTQRTCTHTREVVLKMKDVKDDNEEHENQKMKTAGEANKERKCN